jgi:hypothetical protein
VASVGSYKAEDMAWRLNLALGLDITAVTAPFQASLVARWVNQVAYDRQTRLLLVGCVDNYQARRTLWQYATYLNLEPPTMSSRLLTPANLALWGNGRQSAVEEKDGQYG